MKKCKIFALLGIFAAICSCTPEEPVATPEIELASASVQLTAEGEAVQVAYNITNAAEGATISVAEDADWLEVSTDKPRIIEFSATKNESDGVREAKVTVSYVGAEDKEITVQQAPWIEPIAITIHETDSTSSTFSVTVADPELTWVAQCVGKEWWDEYASDEEVFAEDMNYFEWVASDQDMTLEEYLATVLFKGSKENLKLKGLDPSSDYVIYVYGLSSKGEPTTNIYSTPITTLAPYDGPINFTIEVTEEDHIMDITITPSHEGVAYYWNIMDEATFNRWGGQIPSFAQDYIDSKIEEYLYWEDIYSAYEYFEWYSNRNTINSQFEPLAGTKYIIFASKWDENCQLTGDMEYVWYQSESVEPSDNKITLSVANATQSSFNVTTTTTNNDPYVIMAEPSEWCGWNDMTDEEIHAYVMDYYGTFWITDYICEGEVTEARFYDLDPDTEYTVIAYGYEAGARTTAVEKTTIKTLPLGNPAECTFNFTVDEIAATSVYAEVVPSDSGHYYYWFVFEADATAEDVKQHVLDTINDDYWGDNYEFSWYELSRGDSGSYISYLSPETEYKLAAVIMDEDATSFLSDVHFSETFKTAAMTYADITITATFDKYYDGDALAAAVEDTYNQYIGQAMLPVTISVDGSYEEVYCTIFTYEEGLDDTEVYPDSALYGSLVDYGYMWSLNVNYRAPWDTKLMIAAMAADSEGNYSRIYRHVFTLTKEGASPIEDIIGATSVSKMMQTSAFQLPESKIEFKRVEVECSDLFSTKVVEAKKNDWKVKKEEIKRANAKERLQLRKKAAKQTSGKRYIAK